MNMNIHIHMPHYTQSIPIRMVVSRGGKEVAQGGKHEFALIQFLSCCADYIYI